MHGRILKPRQAPSQRWVVAALCVAVAIAAATLHPRAGGRPGIVDDDEKPELTLRSTPRIGFAPAEILFVAELRGGADDYEELYCAAIEWDWDDDTRSESTPDCDPYEPGTSQIRRRFSARHRYDYGGRYEVRLHLKRRDDTVATARTVVELRGGRFR